MMMKFKFICPIILALMITSCSPIKKLERLHRKNPNLFTSVVDTLTIHDTIHHVTPGTEKDTIFSERSLLDTLYINNGISHTTIYKKSDSIYFNNKVDTIFIKVPYEKKVPVHRYDVTIPQSSNHHYLWLLIAEILLGVALGYIIYKHT